MLPPQCWGGGGGGELVCPLGKGVAWNRIAHVLAKRVAGFALLLWAVAHIWVVATEPGQPQHQCRVVLVRRDREEETVAVIDASTELRVTHELSQLLRPSKVLGQVVL